MTFVTFEPACFYKYTFQLWTLVVFSLLCEDILLLQTSLLWGEVAVCVLYVKNSTCRVMSIDQCFIMIMRNLSQCWVDKMLHMYDMMNSIETILSISRCFQIGCTCDLANIHLQYSSLYYILHYCVLLLVLDECWPINIPVMIFPPSAFYKHEFNWSCF